MTHPDARKRLEEWAAWFDGGCVEPAPTISPADLRSLLDSEAELRASRDEAVRLMSQYAREAGEAKGRLEASEMAGVVEGWMERCAKAEAERDRLKGEVALLMPVVAGIRWGHEYTQVDVAPILNRINADRRALAAGGGDG